jgi:hypothetical protein
MSNKNPLTIDPNYCSEWGFFEGVRELLQNARDAHEFGGHEMSVEHSARKNRLTIANRNVVVPAADLAIIGKTTKRGTDQRGQFGEGFVLGILALARAGHAVSVYNGDEVWHPSIEKAETGPFVGHELLHLNSRKLPNARDAFSVEVDNVSKELWDETKKRFLFLTPPASEAMVVTTYGTVLLGPAYRGEIFARGIYVNKLAELECGYDLKDLRLDRDRRLVDEWELKGKLPAIWNAAHELEPTKFLDQIYDMAKQDRIEVRELSWRADERLRKALRAAFEREHGQGTVPVKDMTESKELANLGAKTVVVNRNLAELLEKTGLSAYEARVKLESSIAVRHEWNVLTSEERTACERLVEPLTRDYIVVTFNKPTLASRVIPEETKVAVARWVLTADPRFIIGEVARQVSTRDQRDVVDLLLEQLLRVMGVDENRNATAAVDGAEAAMAIGSAPCS